MHKLLLFLLCSLAIAATSCGSGAAWQAPTPGSYAASASPVSGAGLKEPFRSSLARINQYRASVGVEPLTPNTQWIAAAENHARYLVMNHIAGEDMDLSHGIQLPIPNPPLHSEEIGNHWYTESGSEIARVAAVARTDGMPADGTAMADEMMSGGFRALSILNPQWNSVGVGSFCNGNDCAHVIVVDVSMTDAVSREYYVGAPDHAWTDWGPPRPSFSFVSARLRKPLEFPAPDSITTLTSYSGADRPDPSAACQEFLPPTGIPILLALGAPNSGEGHLKVSHASLTDDGTPVDACAVTAGNYRSPDRQQHIMGRRMLAAYDAAMVLPREPLRAGHSYHVSMKTNAGEYEWSFRVGGK